MPTDDPNEIFDIIGLDFKKEGSELVTDCPFCGKHKFYLNEKRSVYDCKVCGASGNQHTILSAMAGEVYPKSLRNTHYGRLSTYRGLPEHAFRIDANLGYDDVHGKFVWAARRPDGKVQGLRTWKDPGQGKKSAVHNLKGCKLCLLGAEALTNKDERTVYICEGEWDRHAFLYCLDATGQTGIVLSTPGANNFTAEWAEWLQGRDVVVLYDNDDAGKGGTGKVHKFLKARASRLRYLHWDDKKPDGYDIHDLVKDNLDDPDVVLTYINAKLQGQPTGGKVSASTGVLAESDDRQTKQLEILPIGVPELHSVFRKWLLLENCDLLDIVMGAFWSMHLPGNPLWIFIVAPPSGSKSETIMPASEWWRCHAISNMTSKSLCSGFQLQGGTDPSLLASLDGKRAVIAVKDLTPLLQGSIEERDEVFGILRDAYDGKLSKTFGNGLRRDYKDLHFTFVAGVTPAIDGFNGTSMGERFLKFRADRDTDRADDRERAIRAVENCGQEKELRAALTTACIGALQREFKEDNVPKPDAEFARYVADLAWITAHLRGVAPTDKGSDNQSMAPMVEAAPRLATQFVKLAQGLALHLELKDLRDPTITRLVNRVALHTPEKVGTHVAQRIFMNKKPSTLVGLSDSLPGLGRETIMRTLTRMGRVGLLTINRDEKGKTTYAFKASIREACENTGVFNDLPANDPFYIAQPRLVRRAPTR